ncbi:neuronal acetylcholine receptor subunit alpha-7-like [Amphiura filiformis]|uniref:neuronal acetylcholine receptor subunit alpha-7-like n=1 Tax=Amphiura filiformis TaxID=82378 RepID=UPI003B2161AD
MNRFGRIINFFVTVYVICLQASAQANVPSSSESQASSKNEFHNVVRCELDLLDKITNESSIPSHIRPVKNPDIPTTIFVSFELKTVMDMEEQLQIVKTHCGVTLTWIDHFREWNPVDFCDLEEIGMESSALWLPDLTLMNSADEGKVLGPRPMVAKFTGEVMWDGLVVFQSFCPINFAFFPYDEQKCKLIIRAWSYPSTKVLLRPGPDLEKDETMNNGEWDVVRISSVSKTTERDRKNYSDLEITIHMERRPQFYFMNIIIPCVIIYCLTLFGFCLPADSGEKIGLGITILLSLTVFMLISADMMPPTSDNFPLIAQFYTSTMVLVASSIGMSVIVLNFNHRGPKATKAPKWMRSLLLGKLAKILLISGGNYSKEEACQQEGPRRREEGPACIEECMDDLCGATPKGSNGELVLVPYDTNPQFSPSPLSPPDNGDKTLPSPASDTSCNGGNKEFIERQLRSISSNLQHLVDHHREKDEEDDILDEWKVLATAVDRLCLIIFLTGSLILMFTLTMELVRRTGEDDALPGMGADDKSIELPRKD